MLDKIMAESNVKSGFERIKAIQENKRDKLP
jgi:hypothetical protein